MENARIVVKSVSNTNTPNENLVQYSLFNQIFFGSCVLNQMTNDAATTNQGRAVKATRTRVMAWSRSLQFGFRNYYFDGCFWLWLHGPFRLRLRSLYGTALSCGP